MSLGHRAATLHGIGLVLFQKRDLRDSMMNLQAALTLRQRVFKENHFDVAETLYMIGRILHDQEEYTDALEVYKKVLVAQRITLGTEHPNTLKTLCNIARVHQTRGEEVEALFACSEAAKVGEAMLGPKHTFVVEMLNMQGALLLELEKDGAAMAFLSDTVTRMDSPQYEDIIFEHF
eukprot:CAMPEP_0183303334 /NCGR_PEP_ID=MMETSP0160_2-20130417/8818_1 /TAXON_ID=2839 ORGANISM="Odontella Sinensis, Strain Grunow 1884" /NCGR_SAMPLE_ID=MMETSP0160_2 /ASSEMBLY_ACC=CAM_ASM_000250 /LENGTH=176 /DNA_ID=CAMNT_0025466227 /DNA_START=1 /DNA_END=528 /DNA_ORIENTATION=+